MTCYLHSCIVTELPSWGNTAQHFIHEKSEEELDKDNFCCNSKQSRIKEKHPCWDKIIGMCTRRLLPSGAQNLCDSYYCILIKLLNQANKHHISCIKTPKEEQDKRDFCYNSNNLKPWGKMFRFPRCYPHELKISITPNLASSWSCLVKETHSTHFICKIIGGRTRHIQF